jgi:glycosyltransferase involved in cell wall biosynthesis
MKSPKARNPKSILMTADTVGGVWNYALELSRALGEHNIQVNLATMGAPLSRDQRRDARAIANVEIFESGFKLEWMDNPWKDVERAGNWLLEIERREQPDLIHLNGYAHAALPFRAPKIVVGHSCVLSWWRAVKNENAPGDWNRYRDAVKSGLQSAGTIIAPSRSMLAELNHFYGPLTGKVIHNARDAGHFSPTRKEECILAAGRLWDEAKNISALNEIADALPWPVYIAGETRAPDGRNIKQNRAIHLGKLPPELLSKWFAKAAIYALPARYEPFGLSVLEAALSGCALVLGDIPSLREIWNRAALFIDPNDREQLKFTLQKLIEHPAQLKELASFAQCRAIQFSPQRMAAEYMNIYRSALEKHSARIGALTISADFNSAARSRTRLCAS